MRGVDGIKNFLASTRTSHLPLLRSNPTKIVPLKTLQESMDALMGRHARLREKRKTQVRACACIVAVLALITVVEFTVFTATHRPVGTPAASSATAKNPPSQAPLNRVAADKSVAPAIQQTTTLEKPASSPQSSDAASE